MRDLRIEPTGTPAEHIVGVGVLVVVDRLVVVECCARVVGGEAGVHTLVWLGEDIAAVVVGITGG